MKITLVYPEHSLNLRRHFHPGIGAIGAALKRAGHQVSLVHLAGSVRERALVDAVAAETPDLVGFNSTTHLFRRVSEMSRWIKRRLDVPVICGGVHATLMPEEVLGEESIDMVCVGEADGTFVDLCDALERGESDAAVPGIWRRRDGAVVAAPTPPLVTDLDALPFPDRELFDYPDLEESQNGGAIFTASRGCAFACAHCCYTTLRKLNADKKPVRYRSVENLIQEIEQVLLDYPFVEYILFRDANFAFKRAWLRQFSVEYSRRIGLPFMCNSRPDLIDDEFARLLSRAGCKKINIGLESGNDRIRVDVLKRPFSRARIVSAFALCKEAGITTQSFNMLGVPFETPSTLLDTIRLNAEARPDVMLKSIFYPYPKTELHDLCKRNNFLTGREYDTFLEESVLSQPTVSADQLVFAFHFFHPFVLLFAALDRLPAPARSAIDRLVERLFASQVFPHGPLARVKRSLVYLIRRRVFPRLRDRVPRLYLFLRSRLESRLLVYED